MKEFRACGHYLYVKLLKVNEEQRSEGGIIVRANDSDKREQKGATYAEVMDIGEDCWDFASKPWCNVGDTINIARYGGQESEVPDDVSNEEKKEMSLWKVIRDTDVLGVKR